MVVAVGVAVAVAVGLGERAVVAGLVALSPPATGDFALDAGRSTRINPMAPINANKTPRNSKGIVLSLRFTGA